MPVIGFLSSGSLRTSRQLVIAAFRKGLKQTGFVEARMSPSIIGGPTANSTAAGVGGRLGSPPGGRDRRLPVAALSALAAKGQRRPCRSYLRSAATGRTRSRRQPQPAGRQRHRCRFFTAGFGTEAAWTAAGAGTQGRRDRHARESKLTGNRNGQGVKLRVAHREQPINECESPRRN